MENRYDVCIDKGTYDAISLNPSGPKEFRLIQCFLKYESLTISSVSQEQNFEITQNICDYYIVVKKLLTK